AVQGKAVEREVELFGPPRQTLFVSALPLRLDGRDYGSVALIDDITEPQRLDAMRRDFVANISHELRTPMGALSLLAETLAGETEPEVASRLAARVQAEAIRLSDIMDDLLELSRIESNEASERAPVSVQHVISDALSRVSPIAEEKKVPIETALPALDLVVNADRRQLTSAVYNLLENAVKHSEADRLVRVTTRLEGDCVEVEVSDQGHGIPLRHQERIFERFYQVDRSRESTEGGVGLGLAIVRHVANNHGGEVRVESTEGEGSSFTLALLVGAQA
ncbi:MAG: ATP-binding protein, partial [bacterium]|nr:ATP-binding protein [bacterium]